MTGLTVQTAALTLIIGGGVLASRGDLRRLAALWAVFLPVDTMFGVDPLVFDCIRYGGAIGLVLFTRVDEPAPAERTVVRLSGAILLLALTRLAAGAWHSDLDSVRYGVAMAAGAVIGAMLVRRVWLLPAITAGYLAGLALSAAVSLSQAAHISTIAPANREGQRYPGLAAHTTVISWQMATGLVLACALIAISWRAHPRRVALGIFLVVLFNAALLSNGAQGGLLGVAAAVLVVSVLLRRRVAPKKLVLVLGTIMLLAVATIVGALALGVDIPTITDYRTDNFANEIARIESIQNGLEQFRDHPLVGVPSEEFKAMYGEFPHMLVVESAALTGVLGLVAATVVIVFAVIVLFRGPAYAAPVNIASHALIGVFCASFLTGPSGPVLGVAKTLPFFAAMVLAACPPGAIDWIRPLEGDEAEPERVELDG